MIGRRTIVYRKREYSQIKTPNVKTQRKKQKKYKCKSLIKRKIQE